MSAIEEADLKKDLYARPSDHFKGREAETLDELKEAAWCADQLRIGGLPPPGDDGTYLQFVSLQRNRVASNSSVNIGAHSLKLWEDVNKLTPCRFDTIFMIIWECKLNCVS